jgi:hypothetical protein
MASLNSESSQSLDKEGMDSACPLNSGITEIGNVINSPNSPLHFAILPVQILAQVCTLNIVP